METKSLEQPLSAYKFIADTAGRTVNANLYRSDGTVKKNATLTIGGTAVAASAGSWSPAWDGDWVGLKVLSVTGSVYYMCGDATLTSATGQLLAEGDCLGIVPDGERTAAGGGPDAGSSGGADSFNNLGNRRTDTMTGTTAEKMVTSITPLRLGVMLHNADGTYEIWGYMVEVGEAAPTITASDRDFVIPPKGTLTIQAGDNIEIYGMNSSGAATTSSYTSRELVQ